MTQAWEFITVREKTWDETLGREIRNERNPLKTQRKLPKKQEK